MRSLASALSEVDEQIRQDLEAGDAFVSSRYSKIVRALSKEAEQGNASASKILLQFVIGPRRQEIVQQVQSQQAPEPIHVRIGLYFVRQRQVGELPPFELSPFELPLLTEHERAQLGSNYVLVGNTLVAPQSSTVPLLASATDTPNPPPGAGSGTILPTKGTRHFVCSDCQQESTCDSRAHNKVICDSCRRKRDRAYQEDYKRRRKVRASEAKQ